MTSKNLAYVKGDPAAWLAMRLWYEHGAPISLAADTFEVDREEVMESFRLNRPIAYAIFMNKLALALALASILARFHNWLKRFRDGVERRIS